MAAATWCFPSSGNRPGARRPGARWSSPVRCCMKRGRWRGGALLLPAFSVW